MNSPRPQSKHYLKCQQKALKFEKKNQDYIHTLVQFSNLQDQSFLFAHIMPTPPPEFYQQSISFLKFAKNLQEENIVFTLKMTKTYDFNRYILKRNPNIPLHKYYGFT